MLTPAFLDSFYHDYERIEEAFQAELDVSLKPHGIDSLFDVVARLDLTPGSTAIDAGCGKGRYSLELAQRFGWSVHGIDPVPAHIATCNEELSTRPEIARRVQFDIGRVEDLAAYGANVDFILCRDMLVHVEAIQHAFSACYQVLRQGGFVLVYHQLATDRLEPGEAAWLWQTMGVVPANTNPTYFEAAFAAAGFEVVDRIELQSEWMEHREEEHGGVSRELLHAARLVRAPGRFVRQFGQPAYDMMLGDCLWHIYQMIGKLSPRIYVLRRPVD